MGDRSGGPERAGWEGGEKSSIIPPSKPMERSTFTPAWEAARDADTARLDAPSLVSESEYGWSDTPDGTE